MGVTKEGTSAKMAQMADLLDLPTRLPDGIDPSQVLAFTRADKKGRGGRPKYVLLSRAGKVASNDDWAQDVPDEVVREVLTEAGS